jgi:hypothetical protein
MVREAARGPPARDGATVFQSGGVAPPEEKGSKPPVDNLQVREACRPYHRRQLRRVATGRWRATA